MRRTRQGPSRCCARRFVEAGLEHPELLCVYFYESRHLPEEAKASLDASANRYLAHYQRLVAELLPDVSDEEIHIRILAAWHMVAGMCTDLPDVPVAGVVDHPGPADVGHPAVRELAGFTVNTDRKVGGTCN